MNAYDIIQCWPALPVAQLIRASFETGTSALEIERAALAYVTMADVAEQCIMQSAQEDTPR